MSASQIIRFGVFEVDPAARELRRSGARVKLQDQPFELLLLLVSRPGEVVSHDEVRHALWPADTFVDFDHSVATAVAKLRGALGDSARNALFIETVASRGYKFVAPVAGSDAASAPPVTPAPPEAHAPPLVPRAAPELAAGRRPRATRRWWAALGGTVLAAVLGLALFGVRGWLPRHMDRRIRSIAVLPFQNLSNARDQGYFVDGLTEELITALAQMRGVDVISRTSTMRYRDTNKTVPQVAGELHVDAIVEGSVVRAGSRLRISAQLVDGRSDTHLWARSYDRDVDDAFALQAEVAAAIAGEIHAEVAPAGAPGARQANRSPQGQDAYLRGRYHLNQGDEAAVRASVDEFSAAIVADDGDARSHAGLAEAYIALTDFYERPSVMMPKARAAAERALARDPRSAEAHAVLGAVRFLYDWDWAGAEQELRRAIEVTDQSSDAHLWYAVFLAQMGRFEPAMTEAQRAEALDPLSAAVCFNAGWVYYLARRNDEALARWTKALQIEPSFAAAHTTIWLAYLGRQDVESTLAMTHASPADENPLNLATAAGVYAAGGRHEDAEAVLARIEALGERRYVCAYEVATARAVMGQYDAALRWLRRAVDDRSVCVPDMKTDPRLDGLRTDPRFVRLLREVGFE